MSGGNRNGGLILIKFGVVFVKCELVWSFNCWWWVKGKIERKSESIINV